MAQYGYFATLATEIADSGVGVTIICPGPVAAQPGSGPRSLFGPTGRIDYVEEDPDADPHANDAGVAAVVRRYMKQRLKPTRCAELMAAAMAHGVEEAWLARHPVLALAYIWQVFPSLGWMIMKRIGPKRARRLHEGRSGYDVQGMLFEDKKEQ